MDVRSVKYFKVHRIMLCVKERVVRCVAVLGCAGLTEVAK